MLTLMPSAPTCVPGPYTAISLIPAEIRNFLAAVCPIAETPLARQLSSPGFQLSISFRLMLDGGSDGIPGRIVIARLPSSGLEGDGSGSQTVSRSRSRSLLKSTDRSRERRFQCSKEVDVKRLCSKSVL